MTKFIKKNILIVEPTDSLRMMLSKILTENGAIVIETNNGKDALNLINSTHFDLVISETILPQMHGFDLAKQIKESKLKSFIPIIFLSSSSSESDLERAFDVGASAFINKDEGTDKLLQIIESILTKITFQKRQLILVVEDSIALLNFVKQSLQKVGFQVITAENGLEALEKLRKFTPSLILSDIVMPEMDGITFCKKVNENLSFREIPFVVMSTQSSRQTMRQILEYGAAAYLVKPFNIEELIILIEKILSDQFMLLLKERERLRNEQEIMLTVISSLINALESRDPHTKGHSASVSEIVKTMALKINVDPEDFDNLMIGTKLHDIGKIGITDEILLNPKRLSSDEFNIVKRHPQIGATILDSIVKFKKNIIPIVLYHHERYDGNGYPEGLKGGAIPFWARLTAVADLFDALINDRPHRKAVSPKKAIQMIKKASGKKLCPECVDIFLACYEK